MSATPEPWEGKKTVRIVLRLTPQEKELLDKAVSQNMEAGIGRYLMRLFYERFKD